MRLIGQFTEEGVARRFSLFLKKMGVENTLEAAEKEGAFNIWVYNEDELAAARLYLGDYEKEPFNHRYDASGAVEDGDIEKEIDDYVKGLYDQIERIKHELRTIE